jgi:hypothetical protein
MPCLAGHPQPPALFVEEQLTVVKLTTRRSSKAIFVDCFIIFWLQFKLFSQIIIVCIHD